MMFFKLSLRNIKKSFKDYAIYFMTLIFGISIFYIFNSIGDQAAMINLSEAKHIMIENLVQMLGGVSIFVSFILGYLIVYANNFLIRRRKKEFGLYQTLGMGKGKVIRLLFLETVFIGLCSLAVGLMAGIALSQGVSVMIADMFEADMSGFRFVFSPSAVWKTAVYFGIIYGIVMLFNALIVSRYKMVDLLYGSRKNEVLKLRNPIATVILFFFSLTFIGYAYYLLKVEEVMLIMSYKTGLMFIFGAAGTYLFFRSLAGFLLRVVQMNKKLYMKNLNMFVLRQMNNKINTTTVSITAISLMLLLAMGILASALSLVSAFNVELSQNNLVDVSFVRYLDEEYTDEGLQTIKSGLEAGGVDAGQYLEAYAECTWYKTDETSMEELEGRLRMLGAIGDQYQVPVIKESDYNKYMDAIGREEEKLNLAEDEYAVIANFPQILEMLDDALEEGLPIRIGEKTYTPGGKTCIQTAMTNASSTMETGTYVIKDSEIFDSLMVERQTLVGIYPKLEEKEREEYEKRFLEALEVMAETMEKPYSYLYTKRIIEASNIGLSAMLIFIGLYLGIIFSVTSAVVLAIGQLSESSDNVERYDVLRKIGVNDSMINRALFLQIFLYFMLPLSVAIIHSIVGIGEAARLISMFVNIDLTKNIVMAALFIIIIYGGYFAATYMGSKRIIRKAG